MRQTTPEDLDDLHILRTQPEVMVWTLKGEPDADIEETRKHLATRLPPNSLGKYNFSLCLAETGEFIGLGGCHRRDGELGWPVFGYMFRKEFWGKGYGTEFLKGLLDAYWSLPRSEVELKVERSTVDGDGDIKTECICGITTDENRASQNVMRKSGLHLAKVFEEEDGRRKGHMVTLHGYAAKSPNAHKTTAPAPKGPEVMP